MRKKIILLFTGLFLTSLAILFTVLGCKNTLMDILQAPEITILYDEQEIQSGGEIVLDNVEFGSSIPYTFTIRNKGRTGILTLSEKNPITIDGNFITMFSLVTPEVTVIEPESSTTFVLTFTPFGTEGEKSAEISIENNDDDEGSFTFSVILNAVASNSAPTVTVSSDRGSITNKNPFPVTIIFSSPVIGFTVDEIILENGTAESLQTADNRIYTVEVFPDADPISVTIQIPAGVGIDAAGKGNNISEPISIEFNTGFPNVTISSTKTGYTNEYPIPITITFDQEMTGMDVSDISTTNCTNMDNFHNVDNKVYTVEITPASDPTTVTVQIPYGGAQSISTGLGNEESLLFSILYDGTNPAGSIVKNAGNGYANSTSVELTISANDDPGSGISDMWISNDSNFSTGNWETYATTKTWTISSGFESIKTLYIKFRDYAENEDLGSSYDIFLTEYGRIGCSRFREAPDTVPIFY